jgi:O-antigen ligase
MHANTQAYYCVVVALGAMCLAGRKGAAKWGLVSVALVATALLLLTRSRTTCGAFLAAIFAIWLFTVRLPAKLCALLGIGAVVAALGFGLYLTGIDVERESASVLLLGRVESGSSLSGRLPLWEELLPHAQKRLWCGYGYGSFWNPARVEEVSANQRWAISAAHSSYIETVLDVGLLGAVPLALAVIVSVWQIGSCCLNKPDRGYYYLFALMLFCIISAFSESGFVGPRFLSSMVALGLCHMALWSERQE